MNWIKIETYWNVNKDDIDKIRKAVNIKIETYWNVNDKPRRLLNVD